jgi:hypothetical protein
MKFSVAMCTYNGAAFLREQLASIAKQTRPPDELVICDDRSGDDTPRIIESFAANAPFPVRLRVNEQNLGSTENFARAIGLCRGDLIALSDQDDVWLPEKLRRCERVFAASPRVGMVFTDAEIVDAALRPTGRRLWQLIGFDAAQQRAVRAGRALDVLLPGWTVTGATMAFRAELRDLVLPIPADLAMIHDGWIASVIASVAEVDFIDEGLILYRQHPRQQVGAPEEKVAAAGGARAAEPWEAARAAMRRTNPYAEQLEITAKLHERLTARPDFPKQRDALAHLAARMTHLSARAGMPGGALRRVPSVLRELLARRYHLYSNGLRSAAKDLVRGAATAVEPRGH